MSQPNGDPPPGTVRTVPCIYVEHRPREDFEQLLQCMAGPGVPGRPQAPSRDFVTVRAGTNVVVEVGGKPQTLEIDFTMPVVDGMPDRPADLLVHTFPSGETFAFANESSVGWFRSTA